ncbi:MAG: NYN domain-containing protein [Dehalococcoidia bacterium]
MTLRFFRRKSASSGADADDDDNTQDNPGKDNPGTEEKKPARRGRRGGAGRSRAKTTGTAKASEEKTEQPKASETASAAEPATPSRTRRGRRGGAGRKKPSETKATEEATPTPSRARARPAASDATSVSELQGSLSAIESRLAGIEQQPTGERPRLGIFVDVPNIMYAAERLRAKLDFGKVLEFITNGRELVRASAYAPISDDPDERLETQKFVQPFVDHGYRIVTKPLKRYADGSVKANFDVELAIDVMTMSDRLDIVALVSGDGDFRRLVELVESKGVRVEVVAFGQSTAAELRAVADRYIDLSEHVKELRV